MHVGIEESTRPRLVLFTDLVDSTKAHSDAGDDAAHAFWEQHDRMGRVLIRRHGGIEVGRSDGFLVLFDRVADGLAFALHYHAMLAGLETPIPARVGAHWGSVRLRRNLVDDVESGATPFEVDGLAVPTAARIMSAAGAGQTLFSATAVREMGDGSLPHESRAVGHWRLKGVDEPVELFAFGPPGQGLRPPEDAAKAHAVVPGIGGWVSARALPGNLGSDVDEFVGRADELCRLDLQYDDGARLVTVVGPGGVGKTRLAQRYARGWQGGYPGGTWFCDLASARGVDGIAAAVAKALDLSLGRTDPVQQIAAAIASRGDALLILDNFEQVVADGPSTLGCWLRDAPRVRWLVTSREPLGLPGEHQLVLEPLSTADGVHLFRTRASAAGAALDGDAAAIGELVALLDGLPLAIELAAARARLLPAAEQLGRIGERFRLLATRHGRSDRHATLKATIDWSWQLLTPVEQHALAQLAVFEGGFSMEAAEAVLELTTIAPGSWTPDVLGALLDRSLLRRSNHGRWDLMRSVHDFAAEKAAELGIDARMRHWRHFASLSESAATLVPGAEIDNLVAACQRACAAAAGEPSPEILEAAVGALANAWANLRLTGPFRVGLDLAGPIIALRSLPPALRARALRVAGAASALLGRADIATGHHESGLAAALQAGDRAQASLHCTMLAELALQRGQLDEASLHVTQALGLGQGHAVAVVTALNASGALELARAHPAVAAQRFGEALRLAEEVGDRRWIGGLHGSLGVVLMAEDRLEEAREHLDASVSLAQQMGDRQWARLARCNRACLANALGDHEQAARQLRAVVEEAREAAHRRLLVAALCNLGMAQLALGHLDDADSSLHEGLELAREIGALQFSVQCGAYRAEALARLGRCSAAWAEIEAAEIAATEVPDVGTQVLLLAQGAVVLLASGAVDAAAQRLLRAEALVAQADVIDRESRAALARARQLLSRH